MPNLLHVSDIHFGPPHRPRASDALRQLVADRKPDLVVISGDLTQRAKPQQFREARAWVDSLERPALAVPGNHDVPMYRVWERVFSPFGAYRRHFSKELEPTFETDGLLAVGINSAYNWTIKDGRVSRRTIDRVRERFEAVPSGTLKVAVVHHELVPAPRFGSQKILGNGRPLARALGEARVDLVLSGHLHQAYVSKLEAYHPGVGRHTVVAHSGTSSSTRGRGCERGRSTAFWIEVAGADQRLGCLEWDAEGGVFRERWNQCFHSSGAVGR